MKFKKTDFTGLVIVDLENHDDSRGVFKEVYKKSLFTNFFKKEISFLQENEVKSNFGSLRGLHFQKKPHDQSKLIRVVSGEILDVVVDIRKNSNTYGQYFKIRLSEKSNRHLFIPSGFAHGYLTLTKNAIVNYKVDKEYKPEYEAGIAYDDKFLNIDWELDKSNFIISRKDRELTNYTW